MRSPTPLPDIFGSGQDLRWCTLDDLFRSGMTPSMVRIAVADGRLTRLARGIYCRTDDIDDDSWRTLRLRTAAFLSTAPEGAIAAGWSALAIHAIPTMTSPPPIPTIIRQRAGYHGSDRTRWGHTRYCLVPDSAVTEIDGIRVLTPGFAVCDLARSAGILSSLMAADHVAATADGRQQITAAVEWMRQWPRMPRAAWVARHCDGDAESPLETAGRYRLIQGGLPVPVSNVWLGLGWPQYRVDHWWAAEAVAGEGDGAIKYVVGAEQVRAAELRRHNEIESWGVGISRYDWPLAVRRPHELVSLFEPKLAVPRRTHPLLRWWTCEEGWALIRGQRTLDQCPGRRRLPST